MPNNTTNLVFAKVRDVGDIVNVTVAFLRDQFKPLALCLLFIAGPFLLLNLAASVAFQMTFEYPEPNLDDPLAVLAVFTTPQYYLALLMSFVGQFMLIATTYSYLMSYLDGDGSAPTVVMVRDRIIRDFRVLFSTTVMLGLLLLAMLFLVIIPCLGLIAFVAGLFYFGVNLSIVYVVRLRERIGFLAAYARCRDLIRNYWATTLGLLCIVFIIYIVLAMLFSLPAMIMGVSVGLSTLSGQPPETSWWMASVTGLFGALGSFLVAIPLTAVTFHYFNLVERSEATGLMERVERIGGENGEASGI